MDSLLTSQKGGETFEEAWEDYCKRELDSFFDNPISTSYTIFIPVGYIKEPFRMFSQPTFKDLYNKLSEEGIDNNIELVAILATKRGDTHKRLAIKLSLDIPKNILNKSKSKIINGNNKFVFKRAGTRILITRYTANYQKISGLKKQIKMLIEEFKNQRKYILAASYREQKRKESTNK